RRREALMGRRSTLRALRRAIDAVDDRIVRLLDRRAKLVADIGAVKAAHRVTVHSRLRERQVLKRVVKESRVLPPGGMRDIYRAIMRVCRRLEIEVPSRGRTAGP